MTEPTALTSAAAPAAIGPYSQAVVSADWVFCSGQLGLDPASGELVGRTAAEQAGQALANLTAVLAEAGLSLADVVKTTVFVTDLADFAAINAVYADHFTGPVQPARSTVQVAALPKGGRVEIEAIAHRAA
ncbi:MAG: Rid family detoxifying hydrolase [Propionibacteriaceae bacterium]|jgi:2-iminobutanoate/2-iminopropanoate deaminase|nr:Rid family detoxifying hydrolase [Propionibacteriaceae bacterium]